jgi:hypothetical protein
MSVNRRELVTRMRSVSTDLLSEKGYLAFVDVLLRMGVLTREAHEDWRRGRVGCLERVVTVNLSQINHLLRAFHADCRKGGLRPSATVYLRWGRGRRQELRFSKSGDPNVDAAYATHFVSARCRKRAAPGKSPSVETEPGGRSDVDAHAEAEQPDAADGGTPGPGRLG